MTLAPKPHGLTGQQNALKGPEPRSVRLSVRLPPELGAYLRSRSERTGETQSDIVVRILAEALIPEF